MGHDFMGLLKENGPRDDRTSFPHSVAQFEYNI